MEEKKIYSAIIGVMSEVGAVGKNGFNQQQKFKYRSIDDVMNALQPAMIKNGVFVVPQILEQKREERVTIKQDQYSKTTKESRLMFSICTIKYTFYAEDGSSVECVVVGEGMDSGDKATNKAMAIAFKYACFQVFCIPTEEMHDPDAEVHPQTKPIEQERQKLEKTTKQLAMALHDGDKDKALAYWNEYIKPDANDIERLQFHVKALNAELERKRNEAQIQQGEN